MNIAIGFYDPNNAATGSNELRFVSTNDLDRFEARLSDRLDRHLPSRDGADGAPLNRLIHQYVTRGGKRIRPQLCIWSCRACGGQVNDATLDVAAVWEIFHAFLLVHDDLMDAADTRRGTPSLHRQLQSLDHDSPAFGRNLAIVAGDLLFGIAIRLLSRIDVPPATVVSLMRLFSDIACTTGHGQAVDLLQGETPLDAVDRDAVLFGYQCKTAAYTFEGPLVSGAILAGASAESIETMTAVARAVGQAYQLHNDLLDLATPAHAGCDLVQGKRTVTLMAARNRMAESDRQEFDDRFDELARTGGAVPTAEMLRQRVRDTGAVEQTRSLIDALLTEAQRVAAVDAVLGPPLSELVHAIGSTCLADPVPVGN